MADSPSSNVKNRFLLLCKKIQPRRHKNYCADEDLSTIRDPIPPFRSISSGNNFSPDAAHTIQAQIQSLINDSVESEGFLSRYNSTVKHRTSTRSSTIIPPLSVCPTCGNRPLACRPLRRFSFAELQLATDSFSKANFLAEGENEFVFRGRLNNQHTIAVKTCSDSHKFWTQVEILTFIRHPNIISLAGVCMEEHTQMLAYEHVCNGSLEWHLSKKNPNKLDWRTRHKIAVQIADSLYHLHEACLSGHVLHGDIRPVNIFLSHDYLAKLGGFSFARWVDGEDLASEGAHVTYQPGYEAPETVYQKGCISKKTDVYAFGVLLLQLITGRTAIMQNTGGFEKEYLVSWAQPRLGKSSFVLDDLLDPSVRDSFNCNELDCMIQAANMCLKTDPSDRPDMNQVLRVLLDEDSSEESSPTASSVAYLSNKSTKDSRQTCKTEIPNQSRNVFGGFLSEHKVSPRYAAQCAHHTPGAVDPESSSP